MSVFLDDDDMPRFPIADIEHFLPWTLLHMDVDLADLDEATIGIFAAAGKQAGVTAGMGPNDVVAAFDRWYQVHPPNPALAAALQEAWRELNAGAAVTANPFEQFAGQKAATGVLGGGERPQGTIPGAMARLQTLEKPKKKKW